jgi:hypothetical protein
MIDKKRDVNISYFILLFSLGFLLLRSSYMRIAEKAWMSLLHLPFLSLFSGPPIAPVCGCAVSPASQDPLLFRLLRPSSPEVRLLLVFRFLC